MEYSSFFNSINGDRKYLASDFAKYFSQFIGNGVFPNPSTNLQVIANNDMTVTVKAGPGWINGYMYLNDSDLILPIDAADGVLNRIDRVVLRMDTVGRTITAVVKKSVFASSPEALALQRDADVYELGLADIYVGAGATSISQSSITDLRLNTDLCGIVHGTVEQVDTSTIFLQYQQKFAEWFEASTPDMANQFNVWFDYIKNRLEGIDAAELTLELDEVKSDVSDILKQNLLNDNIRGTTQVPTFTNGNPTKIEHKDSGGGVIRTDTFAYSTNLITEIRTLNTGDTITFKYHTDTLQVEVI